MIKTLSDLTPEILAKIPAYQKKVLDPIFSGSKYTDFNYKNAVAAVEWNYEFCEYKKPIVIVAENPYEAQIFYHLLTTNDHFKALGYLLYQQKNNSDNSNKDYTQDSPFHNFVNKVYTELFKEFNETIRKEFTAEGLQEITDKSNKKLKGNVIDKLITKLRKQFDKEKKKNSDKDPAFKISRDIHMEIHGIASDELSRALPENIYNTLEETLKKSLHDTLTKEIYLKLRDKLQHTLKVELNQDISLKLKEVLHKELFDAIFEKVNTELTIKTKFNFENLSFQTNVDVDKVLVHFSKIFENLMTSIIKTELNSEVDKETKDVLQNDLLQELFTKINDSLIFKIQDELEDTLRVKSNKNLFDTIVFKEDYLFTLNIYSQVIYTWYSFIKNEFNLSLSIEKDFEQCFMLHDKSCIYSAILSEVYCVVSKYPKEIILNPANELHCTTKSAVDWGYSTPTTQWNCNYVNGRNLEKKWFDKAVNLGKPNGLTFEEFQTIGNEDIKAGIITIIKENKGNKGLLDFLGAEIVDEQIVDHGKQPIYSFGKNYDEDDSEKQSDLKIIGYKEHKETLRLYRTKINFEWANDSNGKNNVKLAWVEMVCPSTGQIYLIETCPTFTDVVKAAKWLRPSNVPLDIPYVWQSAN